MNYGPPHSLEYADRIQVGKPCETEVRLPDPTETVARKRQADDDDLPGGWAIQIVRRYEIHYAREGNENVLRLTKRVSLSADETKLRNKPKPSTDH